MLLRWNDLSTRSSPWAEQTIGPYIYPKLKKKKCCDFGKVQVHSSHPPSSAILRLSLNTGLSTMPWRPPCSCWLCHSLSPVSTDTHWSWSLQHSWSLEIKGLILTFILAWQEHGYNLTFGCLFWPTMPQLPAGEGDPGRAFASHNSLPALGALWGEIK